MNTETKQDETATDAPEAPQFNDQRRHELLGLKFPSDYFGGIQRFDGLKAGELETLIAEGFADKNETQNCAPCIGDILDFLKVNLDFTAHGYIVSPAREDCRVSIEGVAAPYCTTAERDAFINLFRDADEFNLDPPRAWYD